MKKSILFLALAATYFLSSVITTHNLENTQDQQEKKTVFIWNDDEESIPSDGSKIYIEFTKNDTIYIGSVEANE